MTQGDPGGPVSGGPACCGGNLTAPGSGSRPSRWTGVMSGQARVHDLRVAGVTHGQPGGVRAEAGLPRRGQRPAFLKHRPRGRDPHLHHAQPAQASPRCPAGSGCPRRRHSVSGQSVIKPGERRVENAFPDDRLFLLALLRSLASPPGVHRCCPCSIGFRISCGRPWAAPSSSEPRRPRADPAVHALAAWGVS
jgi:hypothetical protein